MRMKLQPWHLAAALVVICAGVLGTLAYLRSRSVATPGAMLGCLPRSDAVLVFLDVDGLRNAGILDLIAGSKAAEDLEYQNFVEGSGFNYRTDLKSVAGSFSAKTTYLVLRGSFNWKRLRTYAARQGGTCDNSMCRVPSHGRFISFYPLRSDAMAIAFSNDEWAAWDIAPHQPAAGLPVPDQPVWVSLAGSTLRDSSAIPAGARSIVSPLAAAHNIVVSIAPADRRLQATLNVACASEAAARDLAADLDSATAALRKLLEQEKVKPSSRNLSGILVAGSFRREERRVVGTWPIGRDFIEAVASGSID